LAARRLIALLLVLLFLSSLAAALAPVQNGVRDTSSSTSTTTTADAPTAGENVPGGESRLVTQTVDASAERPTIVRARIGDRLMLEITSSRPGTIELAGLGPAEDVGENQPAYFDVYLRDEGSYPVRFIDDPREIARIDVSIPPVKPATR
jgi:hypothetical protein